MSGVLDFAAGRFRVTKDGRVAFDSDTPAARLAPSETLVLTDYEIEFPDFFKGIIWSLVNARHPILDTYQGTATSYVALVGQDWGPDQPNVANGFHLPDIVLGPAPPGANYLNVKVNLNNTVQPAKIAGDVTLASSLPQGVWTRLAGSSCRLESHGPVRRMFDVVLDGGNIVLRRYQSVIGTEGAKARQSQSVSTANGQYLYYHPGSPGTNAGYAPTSFASVGEWLGNRSSGSNSGSLAPGGGSGVPTDTTAKSYRSVWKGSLEITPGRVG